MVYELFSTGAPVITEGFQNNKENYKDVSNLNYKFKIIYLNVHN